MSWNASPPLLSSDYKPVCSYSCIQIILTLWTWIIYVSVIHHYYVFRSERTTFFWFLTSKHLSVFDECLTILCNYYKPWNTIWLSRFPRGRWSHCGSYMYICLNHKHTYLYLSNSSDMELDQFLPLKGNSLVN